MSSIQFGCCEFNQATQILTLEGKVVELDPRQLALLEFFIANPERIVSRDELQQAIWKQVIVSDNAINKLVANLRKSLDDNPKSPLYIQTVPKQGYRFVAKIKEFTSQVEKDHLETLEQHASFSKSAQKSTWPKIVASLCLCSFVVLMSYVAYSDNQPEPKYGHTQTLTRMTGVKQSPVVTLDQESVLFINFTEGEGQLFKGPVDLGKDAVQPIITPFSSITYLLGFDKSGQLVVRANKAGKCGWFKGLVESGAFVITEQSQLECPQRILRDNEYAANTDSIYFINHSSQGYEANSLSYAHFDDVAFKTASLNLAKKWTASRFEIAGDDVVLLAHTAIGHSGVFKLALSDITAKESELKFENKNKARSYISPEFTLPYRSNNVAWSHDKKGVIYTNAPPATQLLYQSLETDVKPKLVASFSDYICCNIERINVNDDFVFTTEAADYNIEWLSKSENSGIDFEIDNSSSYDFIPAFANTSDDLYFLSKRSGKTQIYKQSAQSKAEQVSDFNAYLRFYGLALSPDDKWITSFESKVIWLLAADKDQADRTISVTGNILSLDWLSNQLFAVSVRENRQVRVDIYNTQMQKVHTLVGSERFAINRVMSKRNGGRDVIMIVNERILYDLPLSSIFDANTIDGSIDEASELVSLNEPIPLLAAVIDENQFLYPSEQRGKWMGVELTIGAEPHFLPFDIGRELTAKDGRFVHSKLVHLSSEVHRTLAQ
ncbi:winged helix-turn-helix domain-containing protein [Pseudoalteromonas phenolica]|uniref:winged helix-turn-helix domain-containing protein n=1 Tax=Pseudoalteromonas phenolica TaxID=161398 RepID=UPI00110AD465|nr:winged helix-turn-helix domain-containing protein [Pseudoalteromonas phenolica]TMO56063.1 hypothetical protein CWC21_09110 [Pseudoalteromonas phenolica]